jgi:hypothetical protein
VTQLSNDSEEFHMTRARQALLLVALMWAAAPASAQELTEYATSKLNLKVEMVLEGLYNPSGIAVRPGASADQAEIFIADSGHLKVVKVKASEPGTVVDVITDFPKDIYGKGPMYDIGPLGLAFLNPSTLVVGGGGNIDSEEVLSVYKLPEDGSPLKADQADHKVGPIPKGDVSTTGEGNFYALALRQDAPDAIYVSSNGDDTKGWVLKAPVEANKLTDLTGFIATKEATQIDAPVGITINPDGYIVVGQMGEVNVPGDSWLTFYSPADGQMRLNLETGLHDIAALAYSKTERLYAVDFAWVDATQGGLFQLEGVPKEGGEQGVQPHKLVSLDKPAAMAFAPDGTLYVVTFGTPEEGSDNPASGKLYRITGDADKF